MERLKRREGIRPVNLLHRHGEVHRLVDILECCLGRLVVILACFRLLLRENGVEVKSLVGFHHGGVQEMEGILELLIKVDRVVLQLGILNIV
jgi:hypothetical protein